MRVSGDFVRSRQSPYPEYPVHWIPAYLDLVGLVASQYLDEPVLFAGEEPDMAWCIDDGWILWATGSVEYHHVPGSCASQFDSLSDLEPGAGSQAFASG